MANNKLRRDKFVYKEGELIEKLPDNINPIQITPMYEACTELGIRQRDYLILKNKLSSSERRILDVIITDTVGQCRLYIIEMCRILHKRKALPSQFLRLL